MSVMTSALVGQGHKTHIILNKADTLRSVHDFARAYGALCWNLSKARRLWEEGRSVALSSAPIARALCP